MKSDNRKPTHVFISYVRNNKRLVKRLCDDLTKQGVKVWLDRRDIKPGTRWQDAVEEAIKEGAFFIACFSKQYNERDETYMNEELTLAIDRLRKLSPDRIWFIPVKLNRCEVPKRRISDVEKLTDLQWVELYKDRDHEIQRILDVLDPIPPETQRLVAALNSGVEEIRPDVIRALGETGHRRALPVLMELLEDEDVTVRGQAAIALGNIGDDSSAPALIEALEDEYDYVRECATVALGNIGDARAIPSLIKALDDMDIEVRRHAVWALGEIGGASVVPVLLEQLGGVDKQICLNAIWALRKMGTPEALKAVEEYEKRED